MRTYLYCLFQGRVDPPPGLAGVGGAPVRGLNVAPVTAWVTSVAATPEVAAAALQHHDHITDAALATGSTPLPARFGEVFDDDAVCRASLSRQIEILLPALERVAGRVEMTVAIPLHLPEAEGTPQPIGPPHASPGRAYLERLRGKGLDTQILKQQGHVLARPVSNALRALILDERATVRTSPPAYLVSHLIARDTVEEYRRLAAGAIGDHEPGQPRRATIRGPSAPYSFAAVTA